MENFAKRMSDMQLIETVQSMDRVRRPLDQRFEGDDAPIEELLITLGLAQNIVNKLLVEGVVLRECSHRGLHIPGSNA